MPISPIPTADTMAILNFIGQVSSICLSVSFTAVRITSAALVGNIFVVRISDIVRQKSVEKS
jgi:hypothetical protein